MKGKFSEMLGSYGLRCITTWEKRNIAEAVEEFEYDELLPL
jgi:hypothetical protein